MMDKKAFLQFAKAKAKCLTLDEVCAWIDRYPPDARPDITEVMKYADAQYIAVTEPDVAAEIGENGRLDSVGLFFRDIAVYKVMTPDEERELFARVAMGDRDAYEQAIQCNLKLVIHVAKKYLNRGMELPDMIQEGSLGLMKAVKNFSLDKKCKFSTYAYWWIRQAITRAIADTAHTIRIPVHVTEKVNRYKAVEKALELKLDRSPTDAELQEALGWDKNTWDNVQKVLPIITPTSLDMSVGEEDGDSTLVDFIPDTTIKSQWDEVSEKILAEKLDEMMNAVLTDRENKVLRLRYGMNPENYTYTLEEVGKMFGLTRERIRQIEGKAIRKLGRSRYGHALQGFEES